MGKLFLADAVTAYIKDGGLILMSPSGDRITRIENMRVNFEGRYPVISMELTVNLVASELEANALYKKAKLAELNAELAKQKTDMISVESKCGTQEFTKRTPKFKIGDKVSVTLRTEYYKCISGVVEFVETTAQGFVYDVNFGEDKITIREKDLYFIV